MNERIKELLDTIDVNPKIRELAEQSGCSIDKMGYGEGNLESFAELIVRECMKVAVFKDDGYISTADVAGYMAAGRSTAAKMIKEHFGVEK